MLFQRIGASTAALNIYRPVIPRAKLSQSKQDLFCRNETFSFFVDCDVSDWSKLVSILDLLGRISNQYVDTTA